MNVQRPMNESMEAGPDNGTPSYHNLHITTRDIPRASIFSLPYGLEVTCSRVGGWCLWDRSVTEAEPRLLAGEYNGGRWLVLDVGGVVIVDSRQSVKS